MGGIEALNRAWFLRINGGADAPAWLVHTALGIADGLILLVPLLLIGLWLWGDHARRRIAIKACAVALVGVAVNQAIGALWPHPRPFMIGLGHAWATRAPDSSFPSDHLTVLSGVGLTLLFDGAARWGLATLVAGVLVAWARVFLGLHFPFDMVGAVLVAAVLYAVLTPAWRRWGDEATNLLERLYRLVFAWPITAGWVRR